MRSSLKLAVGGVVAAAALSVAGLAVTAGPPQAEQVLNPNFNVQVRPGVDAQGFVALSKPYDTAESPARRVRVLAYSIKFLVNGQERLGSFAMSEVDVAGREPHQGSVGGSGPNPRTGPKPGDELLPRRFSVTIRPRGDLTWGAVTDRDQLEVSVEWVTP